MVRERTVALTADVSEAHRQVPPAPETGTYSGGEEHAGGAMSVNIVGTFGLGSAS